MRTPTIPPSEIKLSTVDAINMKSTGQTTLYTVPAGKSCIVTKAILRITTADTAAV